MLSLKAASVLPGLALSTGLAAACMAVGYIVVALTGRSWVDGLVLAIAAGTVIRTVLGLHPMFAAGVDFAAKTVLELAIVLLGASMSFAAVGDAGLGTIAIVASVVVLSLVISFSISRALGLPPRLATLVACGNSICGNSAIVAVSPVIGAKAEEIATTIAFTAALGVIVVLVLPLAASGLAMSDQAYGTLAGLTVYAVPQVLAATMPVSLASAQTGALVKLMRVLMLGPVILILGIEASSRNLAHQVSLKHLLPWFIGGFLLMMGLNSAGAFPTPINELLRHSASLLTVTAMAALGLTVDLHSIIDAGGRVLTAGVLSILSLFFISLAAIYVVMPALALG